MNQDIKLICRLNENWTPQSIKIKRAGGQTNRNFIVRHRNNKFFVRIPWERKDVVSRKIESQNILALSRCEKLKKILPTYFIYILKGKNVLLPQKKKFDLPDGTMMTEYIPGRIFTPSLFRHKKYQVKLLRMFYAFHTSGVSFVNKYNVFRDELQKYRLAAQKLPVKKLLDNDTVGELNQIEKIAKSVVPATSPISTHNDFIFQNFLLGENGKIYLLDFEYAGMNERGGILYDFAFLFADNLFRKPPMTKQLFEGFLENADKIYKKTLDRKQIYWLAISVPVMQVWWGILRYFSVNTKKEKQYFKEYVFKRAKGTRLLYKIIQGLDRSNPCGKNER